MKTNLEDKENSFATHSCGMVILGDDTATINAVKDSLLQSFSKAENNKFSIYVDMNSDDYLSEDSLLFVCLLTKQLDEEQVLILNTIKKQFGLNNLNIVFGVFGQNADENNITQEEIQKAFKSKYKLNPSIFHFKKIEHTSDADGAIRIDIKGLDVLSLYMTMFAEYMTQKNRQHQLVELEDELNLLNVQSKDTRKAYLSAKRKLNKEFDAFNWKVQEFEPILKARKNSFENYAKKITELKKT